MRLAVLGASGHGKVVADTALLSGWSEIVFFDDSWPSLTLNGIWVVAGNTQDLISCLPEFDGVVVAIGHNQTRSVKQEQLSAAGASLVTIIHPRAVISPYATIAKGSVIFANACINAFAVVHEGSIINTGSVIEHDVVVGAFSHISPNAVLAGAVRIGCCVWIGACASVRQCLQIADHSTVGMGAVVTKDVASGSVVAGCPAIPLIR